jgi:hypothetical protein
MMILHEERKLQRAREVFFIFPFSPFYGEIKCCFGQLSSDYTQETQGIRGDSGYSAGILQTSLDLSRARPQIQQFTQAGEGIVAERNENVMHQRSMRPCMENLGGPSTGVLRNAAGSQQSAQAVVIQQVQSLSAQGRYQPALQGIAGAASASQLNAQPQQPFSNGRGQMYPVQPSPFFGRGQLLGPGPMKQQTGPMTSGNGAFGEGPTSLASSGGVRGGRGGARRQGYAPHAGSAIQTREHAHPVEPMPTASGAAQRSDAATPAAAARSAGPTAARGSSRGRARGRQ